MLKLGRLTSICVALSACVTTPNAPALKPNTVMRGVDSGVQQVVDDYYSVAPDCSNMGYPEIRILSAPGHGSVAVEQGEVYPGFAKDNVRYECNKAKVASSRLMYKSNPGFHGKDSFTIQVRFVNSNLRLLAYTVDVL
jgi:hypothetical protein